MAIHVVAGGFRLRLLAGTLGYEKCGARRRAFSTPFPFEIAESKDFEIVNLKIQSPGAWRLRYLSLPMQYCCTHPGLHPWPVAQSSSLHWRVPQR
jgi:hypothetical protein